MATLSANIDASQRSIRVTDGAAVTGGQRLRVDDELIDFIRFDPYPYVNGRRQHGLDPTRWVVTRGVGDSTPASHLSGATLTAAIQASVSSDSLTRPDPFPEGSNQNPVAEPFVVQSDVTNEAVLHIEATESGHTASLLDVQSANGIVFAVGAIGNTDITPFGDPVAGPLFRVSPQNLNSDPLDDIVQYENNFGVNVGGVTKNGYTYIADLPDGAGGPTEGAPDNAELVAGQCIIWFDKTNGSAKLMVKAKTANGTVVTGEVALT